VPYNPFCPPWTRVAASPLPHRPYLLQTKYKKKKLKKENVKSKNDDGGGIDEIRDGGCVRIAC
jgi:hypothetical protein